MTRIENITEISAEPKQVWQYIWELNNLPSYLPISDVKILDLKDNIIIPRLKERWI